jgi:carbamoyltransferase
MIVWGINALNHDASICVFQDNKPIWHRRSSDFTHIKGDPFLNDEMIYHAKILYGNPGLIYWYEKPFLKKLRQLRAGQFKDALSIKDIPGIYLKKFNINCPITYTGHHHSHAAAGYYTSNFNRAAVVVADAIGEFETMSIWRGYGRNLEKLWSRSYPNSIGIFYSAFTDLIGLKPNSEEHVLQKLSEKGDHFVYYDAILNYFKKPTVLRYNLHKGVYNWPFSYNLSEQDVYDIAAAVQKIFEEQMDYVMVKAKQLTSFRNLVYMGGCAYNSKFNQQLRYQWRGIWSLPWPGDASSAIGAVLAHTKTHVNYLTDEETNHIEVKYNKL